jgi:hypothetical protein
MPQRGKAFVTNAAAANEDDIQPMLRRVYLNVATFCVATFFTVSQRIDRA